ncbi:MAG: ABC transporter ATP-binding protein [Candidatus Vecturithrix sp.]|jgi:peptide/nickel transport system ATP-binding protein|nr:ABC transporter ATP-binding protein [Candidatus Vecturithrix sp.]
MEHILEVKHLNTFFEISQGIVRAVEGVSFNLNYSESIGLVGESGCGKTTTALSVMGMLPENGFIQHGEIFFEGQNIAKNTEAQWQLYRWSEISMIFQGAMNALNPVMKISHQITEAIKLHEPDISEKAMRERVLELFHLVGLDERRIDNYPHEFSGGMRQRVMIAMALACRPKLIIGDEPTTALDVMVQAQIIELINELREKLQLSMIAITHDLSIISDICDKVAVMYAGNIVEIGSVRDVIRDYKHPYSQKLIKAFPNIYGKKTMVESIPGDPPNLLNPPSGCRFHPRCEYCLPLCKEAIPELVNLGNDHFVACHVVGRN